MDGCVLPASTLFSNASLSYCRCHVLHLIITEVKSEKVTSQFSFLRLFFRTEIEILSVTITHSLSLFDGNHIY